MNILLNSFNPIGLPAFIRLSDSFPGPLAYWLFETHWLYWAGLALIAAAVLWRGMITHSPKGRYIGSGILLITILWMLAAWLVVTPRERMVEANEAVVLAAGHDDIAGIMGYIAPQAMFGNLDRAAIRQMLVARLREADISSNNIRRLRVRLHGRYGTSRLNVLSFSRAMGAPVITYWRLGWVDHAAVGNWQITHIRLLKAHPDLRIGTAGRGDSQPERKGWRN